MNKNVTHTFCMLKSDICNRNLIGRVLTMLEDNNFKIVKIESKQMPRVHVEEFYKDHKEKFFFVDMVTRLANSVVVGCLLERKDGKDPVVALRTLMGATNPANAEIGTIRHIFALSIDDNSIHGSDSFENVLRESEIFFNSK